ncbi:MAG: 50S ribosomal protein L21 [Tenacibaculum sp.]
MYAIVEIAGQQFKVAKDQKVFVHRLQDAEGSKVSFDKVMLIEDKGNVTIGAPAIKGAGVTAEVLNHIKGNKVIVFKKKRRKGYKKKNGHRQQFTEIQIKSIETAANKAVEENKKAKTLTEETNTVDDLKLIEGIGPKIAEKLINAGVSSFIALAKLQPTEISELIAEVQGNHNTETWSKQAALAADGKWDELKELQDKLHGGIEK